MAGNSTIFSNTGIVKGAMDGIVTIMGLSKVQYNETVRIVTGKNAVVVGLVLNITVGEVSVVVLRGEELVKPGQYVIRNFVLMSVPVGSALLGRIVDPLGNPLDDKGPIETKFTRMTESLAPSIIARSPVNTPLETGLKVVDSMIPVGHGQRELIIGDSKTGKTSVAIDTILNQKGNDTICIYVAIGQKRSSVARIAKVLELNDCLKSTIIVAATASDSAALQYVAPYSGSSMAEYFMNIGMRALVIYDDLTKHGVSYRQLSLLLRRPPGREGYPGDVFYSHARLLERASNLGKGGSVTALPVVETIQGDVSGYIATNVISITDGQIVMEVELFSKGIRPAVSPGLSVSRVGSAAQNDLMKKMAGTLKLTLAQYREVEGFAKLGLALDDATTQLVNKGTKLTKLLIQNRYSPVSIDRQILFLYAALNGYLDWMDVEQVAVFESELFKFYSNSLFYYPFNKILSKKNNKISDELLKTFIWNFTSGFISFHDDVLV